MPLPSSQLQQIQDQLKRSQSWLQEIQAQMQSGQSPSTLPLSSSLQPEPPRHSILSKMVAIHPAP